MKTISTTALLVVTFLTASAMQSYSASVCDTVLATKAFDTTDFSQSSSIFLKKRDAACQQDYNSQSEAVAAGQAAGGSIGYEGFSFSANDARQSSSTKWSIKDSKLCTASAEELDSITSSSVRRQVASIAVAAWAGCISSVETSKLFVEYTSNADGSGMTGIIHRHLGENGGVGKIIGIIGSIQGKDNRIKCSIGTMPIKLNDTINIQIDKARTALACSKPSDIGLKISLVTTEGDQDWISMPSASVQKQLNVANLNSSIGALRIRLEKFQSEVGGKITEIKFSVSDNKKQSDGLMANVDVIKDDLSKKYVKNSDQTYVKYNSPLSVRFNNEQVRCLRSAAQRAFVLNDANTACAAPTGDFLWLLVHP